MDGPMELGVGVPGSGAKKVFLQEVTFYVTLAIQ